MSDRPQIAVVQHVEVEGLGTLEAPLGEACDIEVLPGWGDPVVYRRAVDKVLRGGEYDGLVVLGGPQGVYERDIYEALDDSLRLIRAGVRADVPILGICLGAQMLAWVLGAQVRPGWTIGLQMEIGWFLINLTDRGFADPIFHDFRFEQEPVFHLHGDTFDIPRDGWHLASSDRYHAQAFRWGRWSYGLQFHIEVTARMVEEWLEANRAMIERLDYVNIDVIREQAQRWAPRLEPKARVLGEHFAYCADLYRRERLGERVEAPGFLSPWA